MLASEQCPRAFFVPWTWTKGFLCLVDGPLAVCECFSWWRTAAYRSQCASVLTGGVQLSTARGVRVFLLVAYSCLRVGVTAWGGVRILLSQQ